MPLNNAKFFVDDDKFCGFDTTNENNNIIKIGPLEFSKPAPQNGILAQNVYCSFRGEYLPQVTEGELTLSASENSFAVVTDTSGKTYILFAVAKMSVDNIEQAKKTIRGMLVDYELAQLTTTGACNEPLYEVSTYLSDGTLVSPTMACTLSDVMRKIQALQAHFDQNEAGYYVHKVRIALAQK